MAPTPVPSPATDLALITRGRRHGLRAWAAAVCLTVLSGGFALYAASNPAVLTRSGSLSNPPPAAATSDIAGTWRPLLSDHDVPLHGTNFLDRWHLRLSNQMLHTVDQFDSFFGDDRLDEETTGTRVKVALSGSAASGEGLHFGSKVNAQLALPQLEHRLHLVLQHLSRENDMETGLIGPADLGTYLGVRYLFPPRWQVKSHVEAGANFHGDWPPVTPYVNLRVSRSFDLPPWTPRLTGLFGWESDPGFNAKGSFHLDRTMNSTMMFRSLSQILVTQDTPSLELYERISLYHRLNAQQALSYDAGVLAHNSPARQVDKYGVGIIYRQRLYRDWVYAELQPGLLFPQDRHYELTPAILLKIEMIFGEYDPGTDFIKF